MSDELRLDGRVAIITGAGRGIGRAHALALASRGAQVLVNDLGGSVLGESSSIEPAQAVVEEIVAAGGHAVANGDNVSDASGARAVIDATRDAFGRLDIVVTNAGISYPQRPFAETTLESFDRILRVHVHGTWNMPHAAWPYLVEQGYGRIITTTSQAGFYGQPGSQEYSAAKGAIVGLTLSLAHESERNGIRVNGIAPAAFTRMVEDLDVDEQAMTALKQLLAPELVPPLCSGSRTTAARSTASSSRPAPVAPRGSASGRQPGTGPSLRHRRTSRPTPTWSRAQTIPCTTPMRWRSRAG
jgi:NAD(P)-dependent dehydrogenase (short-subunit alcohol dehydrogenase family)